jgi:hypothetical protein
MVLKRDTKPLTEAEHRQRQEAAEASAKARHRAETAPSVQQGSTGTPSRAAVGLFRQGQSRPGGGRAGGGLWDTRTSEATLGSVNARFRLHFPDAYRGEPHELAPPVKGRPLVAEGLGEPMPGKKIGGSRYRAVGAQLHRDLVIENPGTFTEALRHPKMREILQRSIGVVREHQAGTVERGYKERLIPPTTPRGLAARAYKHAALMALHRAGVGDYDFHMDPEAKRQFRGLERFMRFAHRRVFDRLHTEAPAATYEPFKQQFGQPFRSRKRGRLMDVPRYRMRPNERFVKLAKGWTNATGVIHSPGRGPTDQGDQGHQPIDVTRETLDRIAGASRKLRFSPKLHVKHAARQVEHHLLGKRWDNTKHPREHTGQFASKTAERVGGFAGGGVGAAGGTYLGYRHGADAGAWLGRKTGIAYGRAADAIRGKRGIASQAAESAEMAGARIGRHLGHNRGMLLGAALVGIPSALAGRYVGAKLDRLLSRRRAKKAGKLEQWRRLNEGISVRPTSRKQLKHAFRNARSASGKIGAAHAFVRGELGKRASAAQIAPPIAFAMQPDPELRKVSGSFSLSDPFSEPQFGDYTSSPAMMLRRAMRPRMRHRRATLRLNTQRGLRHALSGGVTRQERWQLGAGSGFGKGEALDKSFGSIAGSAIKLGTKVGRGLGRGAVRAGQEAKATWKEEGIKSALAPAHVAGRMAGAAVGGARGAKIGGAAGLASDYVPLAYTAYSLGRQAMKPPEPKPLGKGVIGDAANLGRRISSRVFAHPRVVAAVDEARALGGLMPKTHGYRLGRTMGAAIGGERGARIGGHVGRAAGLAPVALVGGGLIASRKKRDEAINEKIKQFQHVADPLLGKAFGPATIVRAVHKPIAALSRHIVRGARKHPAIAGLAAGAAALPAAHYLQRHPGERTMMGAVAGGLLAARLSRGRSAAKLLRSGIGKVRASRTAVAAGAALGGATAASAGVLGRHNRFEDLPNPANP